MGTNEDNKALFVCHKLPNLTLKFSNMTYLHITFKKLTLYGSRCILFKSKYKSVMDTWLISTSHLKTWHYMVQDAYALGVNINKLWLRMKTIKC
jgi:hypothetical protein